MGILPFYDSSSGEVTWQPIGFDTADWGDYTSSELSNTCPLVAGGALSTGPGYRLTDASVALASLLVTQAEQVVFYDITCVNPTANFGNYQVYISTMTSDTTLLG